MEIAKIISLDSILYNNDNYIKGKKEILIFIFNL